MFKILERLKQLYWAQITVICLRYLIGSAFVFASIVKIQGERFTILSPETRIGHFFEAMYQTGAYWQFLGWVQLTAAFFLMTQRFSALGAVIFFPIILNIFVITLALGFSGTPIVTGLMLLATTGLLVWDYDKFLPLFQRRSTDNRDFIWIAMGVLLFLTAIGMKWLATLTGVLTSLVSVLVIMFVLIGFQYFRSKKYRGKQTP